MNPSEPLRHWINDFVFESEFIKSSRTYFYTSYPNPEDIHNHQHNVHPNEGGQFGFGIELKF